jgi:hypothetical protein
MQGKMPYFEQGVKTEVIPDDGTPQWQQRFQKAQNPRVVR